MIQRVLTRQIRIERLPACILCRDEGRLLYEKLVDRLYGVPGQWSLRKCRNPECGLVWQDPMIVGQDLPLVYKTYHTHIETGLGLEANSPGWVFTLLDRLNARILGLANQRAGFRHAFLHDLPPGALLDVGCGRGNLGVNMQKRGWVVRGTDFDSGAAAFVTQNHGFPVDVGELHEIAYSDGAFDAVTARHVIEHIREPFRFLRECWRILRPGGRLVLVTPNSASLGHRIFQEHWRGLEPPRHLFLYGTDALRSLALACGIKSPSIFSTAQGASWIFRDSESIRVGKFDAASSWLNTLVKFWFWQFREVRQIRKGIDECGEELILIADKPR